MKKKILSLILTAALSVGLGVSAFAANAAATPSPTKLMVNGEQVAVDAYAINGNNYIKIRDMAYVINGTGKNFEVTWNGSKNAIDLKTGTAYTPTEADMVPGDGQAKTATLATSKIYVDGVETAMTAYLIGENNYFKLRDVMQIFDVHVGYADGVATLDTSKGYEAPTTPPAVGSVSDNWKDLEFNLDGVKFALPFAFKDLQAQGWTVDFSKYKDMDESYVMNPGDKVFGTIALSNSKYHKYFTFWVGFQNNTDAVQTILNCDVWTVKLDTMNGFKQLDSYPAVTLAKGLTWGATVTDVVAALGEPKDKYQSTSTTNPKYTKLTYQEGYDLYYILTVYDDFGLTAVELKTQK